MRPVKNTKHLSHVDPFPVDSVFNSIPKSAVYWTTCGIVVFLLCLDNSQYFRFSWPAACRAISGILGHFLFPSILLIFSYFLVEVTLVTILLLIPGPICSPGSIPVSEMVAESVFHTYCVPQVLFGVPGMDARHLLQEREGGQVPRHYPAQPVRQGLP